MKKTALITDVNTGIGLLTAMDLARAGVTVCMACGDRTQGQASRDKILQVVPTATIEIYDLDLSSFASIRRMVSEFKAKHQYLDVLINNTDTGSMQQELTQEGFEPQFGIHYLGPFLLTHLLLPVLEATVAVKGEARILHAASITHLVGKLNEHSFSGQLPYRPVAAYAQSKLASLMFNFTLARRLPAGITTHAFHLDGGDACIWRKLPRLVYAFLRL
ncbi:MAG: SDR family NAD(P)-dependent oxidoreductase, partial [Moraxellaceae bacterium]